MGNLRDDIERYRNGEMSSAEMNSLERKALDDPFLADALEGIETVSPQDVTFDLDEIKAKLNERIVDDKKSTTALMWTLRIAATLTIVIIGTYLLTNLLLNNPDGDNKIALNKESVPAEKLSTDSIKSLPAEQDQPKAKGEFPPVVEQIVKQRKEEQAPATPKPSAEDRRESAGTSVSSPPAHEVVSFDDSQDEKKVTATQGYANVPQEAEPAVARKKETVVETKPTRSKAAPPTLSQATEEIASADKADDMISPMGAGVPKKVITGQVLDAEDGKGLPGVNVTIAGTNMGTVTDAEGNYQIPLNDIHGGLLFSFIGFVNQEVVPGAANQLTVTLEPDYAELSEVVVVGYGVARDTLDGDPILEMAAPKGGRKAYKQYLVSELRYPEQALENNVEGKVTVQFTVETSGKLTEFKVLKGIGYGCDEEVIRLIKEGPKWSSSRRNTRSVKDKVRVRLRFALPKK